MTPTKPTPKKQLRLKAKEGLILPVVYMGQVIRITSEQVTTLDVEKLPYGSKLHIDEALKLKHIEKVQGEK